jgi:hypothetical protein
MSLRLLDWRFLLSVFFCATLALAPAIAETRAGSSARRHSSSMGSGGSQTHGKQQAPPRRSVPPLSPETARSPGSTPALSSPAHSAPALQPSASSPDSFFQRHPFLTGVAGGFLGLWLFGGWAAGSGDAWKASVPGILLQLLIISLLIYFAGSLFRRAFSRGRSDGGLFSVPLSARTRWGRRTTTSPTGPNKPKVDWATVDIQDKAERLAKKAWGPRDDNAIGDAVLSSRAVANITQCEHFLKRLLAHVRQVAPKLSVPFMVPKVVVQPLLDAGGQFVEKDGYVKIIIGSGFFLDPDAAQAILCHEVCHYVLGANGIRKNTTEENERLTDVAMFIFGLGDIFLRGYRGRPGYMNRNSHRLGYLSDDEYEFLRRYVVILRQSGKVQPTEVEELDKMIGARIHTPGAPERLLAAARAKHPDESEVELRRRVLSDLERDNR